MKFLNALNGQKIGVGRSLARLCLALALGGALPALAAEWHVSKAEGDDTSATFYHLGHWLVTLRHCSYRRQCRKERQ